jgi:hypothetical protein
MVRRMDKLGGFYHEPPYTKEEEMEFYRRIGGGPKTVVHRPASAPKTVKPKSPKSRRQLALCCDSTVKVGRTRLLRVDQGVPARGYRADFQNM